MAKKQTYTLDYQEDYDFILLGIFCAYRDYRLCFEVDKILDLSLERLKDVELKMEKKGSSGLFPVFLSTNVDDEYYFIIGNKGSIGHFIPELKQIDYFLKIRNFSRYTKPEELIKKLKTISIVSSVIELNPEEMKSAENFLIVEPA
jgi:hypothetical protein